MAPVRRKKKEEITPTKKVEEKRARAENSPKPAVEGEIHPRAPKENEWTTVGQRKQQRQKIGSNRAIRGLSVAVKPEALLIKQSGVK